jgi:hypothetical protein
MKRWTTTKTIVAGTLAACLLCCATAEAKRGGNKPAATGVIYYQSDGVWELSANGTQNSVLTLDYGREPSYAIHDSYRWFLNTEFTEAAGPQLDCRREDGAVNVLLTNDPSVSVDWESMRWVNSIDHPDAEVAFRGEQIDTDPDSDSFGESLGAAIYIASISFDSNGFPSLTSVPQVLLDDTKDFDFSPDGSLLVYEKAGMLFVYDRLLEDTVPLGTNGENPANPQFSPDGSRIAYRSLNQSDSRKNVTAIYVAELDFDGGTLFVSRDSLVVSESLRLGNFRGSVISSGPYWSPDGNYLAYGSEDWNSNTSSVMRITADGSSRTNLSSTQSLFVRGWR